MNELLDMPRSHPRILSDSAEKRSKVRTMMDTLHLDAVIISRRDQFAWITTGGESGVLENSETSVAYLVITPASQYLVAYMMDGDRLMQEQIPGQGYELVSMRWFEGDLLEGCKRVVDGPRIGCDVPFPGFVFVQSGLVDLHYPLTDLEISRCRWLGLSSAEVMYHMADFVEPGQSEMEIAAEMRMEHIRRRMDVDVLIVGSDERVYQYRHPMATTRKLEHHLMLHSAARRWGLHANVTRFIHFGAIPSNIRRIYNAASAIEGKILLNLTPGLPFSQILEWQKQGYADVGFPEEWKNHFQGGPTGYVVVDAARCLTSRVVELNQPYEWFITITGTKVGELTLLTSSGVEVASNFSNWPQMIFSEGQRSIQLPDILEK